MAIERATSKSGWATMLRECARLHAPPAPGLTLALMMVLDTTLD